jgi:hypothetical protein
LLELGLHLYFAGRAPAPNDYAPLAPRLKALKQPGQPVVVAPAWAEPLVRAAAPTAFPIAELTRVDDTGYYEFWQVSLLGQEAPSLAGFATERTERLGPFTLSLRKNPRPAPSVFDFVTAVDAAQVEVYQELEGARLPCRLEEDARLETGGLHGHVTYPKRRFACTRERFVAVTLSEDQDYRAHRCILARLPTSGRLVLSFSGVPEATRLVGHAGFSWFLERDAQAPQVELSVSAAGRELGRHRASGGQGFSRFELPAANSHTVEIALERIAPAQSDFCFALEAK